MARIFISFTSHDQKWEKWIAARLRSLGHEPLTHVDTPGGLDLIRWMEEHMDKADRFLAICSPHYFRPAATGCAMERNHAQTMLMAGKREASDFLLIIDVKPSANRGFLDGYRRVGLHNRKVDDARAELDKYVGSEPPGKDVPCAVDEPPFPGWFEAISNIPIQLPLQFIGREDALTDIDDTLNNYAGKIATVALTGIPGLGKSAVAAAYAEENKKKYRATWWIRAENEISMTDDLVALAVRLGWASPDEDQKEDVDVKAVLRRIETDGEDILLIYDNARNPGSLLNLMPRRGAAHLLITSNALDVGEHRHIVLKFWPKDLAADYLLEHAVSKRFPPHLSLAPGRDYLSERADAEALSEAFEGLPFALALLAAFSRKTGMSLSELRHRHATGRLDGAIGPLKQVIALAIDEASKIHNGAELLLKYAALLQPEPIPLYLFSEGAEFFCEHSTHFGDDALDNAISALRSFGLIERNDIPDQRRPDEKPIASDSTVSCVMLQPLAGRMRSRNMRAHI